MAKKRKPKEDKPIVEYEGITAALAFAITSETSWIKQEFKKEFKEFQNMKRAKEIIASWEDASYNIKDVEKSIMDAAIQGYHETEHRYKDYRPSFKYFESESVRKYISNNHDNIKNHFIKAHMSALTKRGFNVQYIERGPQVGPYDKLLISW